MHLSIILADMGRFAALGGVVIHTGNHCLVIEDHHLRPAERVQFVADRVDLDAVTGTDVTVLTDVTPDCDAGIHEWVATYLPNEAVSRCVRCGSTERTGRLPHSPGGAVSAPRLCYHPDRGTLDHGLD